MSGHVCETSLIQRSTIANTFPVRKGCSVPITTVARARQFINKLLSESSIKKIVRNTCRTLN